ncbi:MAG: efflux RND transporter periplasmic adaptor subunit, partial [Syntrophobacteraceae bacterium]|nr:efflux RND transporter periplasmic adaptor subunit [Syntrophobacteraceae bacterium]
MKTATYIVLLLIVSIGSYLGGTLHNEHAAGRAPGGEQVRRILYYVDPMDPSHISDKPGIAPCGMPMEPVYADEGPAGSASANGLAGMLPGTININSARQQLIGVKVAQVEMAPQTQSFRTVGRVVPDENRLHRVIASVDGWIREVHGSTTGSLVQMNQVMATYFTIEFLNKQQQYFYAMDLTERHRKVDVERPGGAAFPDSTKSQGVEFFQNAPYSQKLAFQNVGILKDPVELSRVELRLMGVGPTQLEQITRHREYASNIEIRAPVTGFVLGRNATPDQRFERGTEMFLIGDLSHVWVTAHVFEREARHIQPGLPARVALPQQGRSFEAVVSDVPPQFDGASRTYRVRLELDNPDFSLRPDMVVDVELLISHPQTITVPTDAVIDSGLRKTVFVDLRNGIFEPRSVETGWRSEDRIEITNGLFPGERIVVAGNFLVNSESRIRHAVSGKTGPHEGHTHGEHAHGEHHHGGHGPV